MVHCGLLPAAARAEVAGEGTDSTPLAASLPACPQALWAEGGVSRFYRGFSPCIMRAAPANGVMLFTVDRVSYLLADR